MFNLWKQRALSHTVTSQLISHDYARHILKAFQQPSKESFGGPGIPPWLNENVENDAVLIHGAPKIVLHALNPDEHLIHVPLIPGSWSTPPNAFGEAFAEFPAPAPNGLIGDDDAALGQQELNIS